MSIYESTVVALVHTIAKRPYIIYEQKFVMEQCKVMPDYLSFAMKILTMLFVILVFFSNFKLFYRLSLADRIRILASMRASRFSICRDFIRFYETLTIFSVSSKKVW